MEFEFKAVGLIHSPFKRKEDISRERCVDPLGFVDVRGQLEVFPDYTPGLLDLEGFSHLFIQFVFHESAGGKLRVHPPYDKKERGVFASRSPHRPNPLGLTVVRLEGVEGNKLHVSNLDMIEGTPVLDIKPYTPRDLIPEADWGWLTPFVE